LQDRGIILTHHIYLDWIGI